MGKSTMVRLFAKDEGLRLAEINLEKQVYLDAVFKSLNLQKIILELEIITEQRFDDSQTLLFLDEIQATPHALAALRYFYEERPGLRVVAAGSLLEFVLADHSFSMPVGRVEYAWVRPLCFLDFLRAQEKKFLAETLQEFQLGADLPQSMHRELTEQYRWYLTVGGMPEATAAFIEGGREKEIKSIHNNIVASYADDFGKYAKQTELRRLQEAYRRLPYVLGNKIKYSEVIRDEKSSNVRHCIDLLIMAGIVSCVYHSDCSGIPVRAGIDRSVFKLFWLDCGLLNRMLGLTWESFTENKSVIYAGVLAEQFVAQEFLAQQDVDDPEPLIYWLRNGKKGNAEIDFVMQKNQSLIPIEVKSNAGGSLKSLPPFLSKTSGRRAIKLSAQLPQTQLVTIKQESTDFQFDLIELPLYMAGLLRTIKL